MEEKRYFIILTVEDNRKMKYTLSETEYIKIDQEYDDIFNNMLDKICESYDIRLEYANVIFYSAVEF